jgi:uncharacterized membrane protein YadS
LVLSLIHFSLLLLTIAAISFFSTVLIFILGLISQLLSMSTKNIEVWLKLNINDRGLKFCT